MSPATEKRSHGTYSTMKIGEFHQVGLIFYILSINFSFWHVVEDLVVKSRVRINSLVRAYMIIRS